MCYEKIVDTGAGVTDYLMSRANQNNPYALSMPDREGSEVDGQVSGSDFQADSVCCTVPF